MASIKVFEFLKLSLKPGMYKNTDTKEWLTYVLNSTAKNLTVVDIGQHRQEYLFDMVKLSSHTGKLITFEADNHIYKYLLKMKSWLKMKNVTVENLSLTDKLSFNETTTTYKKKLTYIAPVIDINERLNKDEKPQSNCGVLDHYFMSARVKPDLLKIKTDGSELEVLKSGIQTLETCKPKILLECRETQRCRESLLATFEFLTDLKYSGYFILDTMKIPLSNFDFNIYQNESYGFYCNNFLFE